MIRSELVAFLSDANPGLSARELDLIVTVFFDTITARLADGGRVELRGFGAFSTRSRDGRTGRGCHSAQARSLFQTRQGNARTPERLRQETSSLSGFPA